MHFKIQISLIKNYVKVSKIELLKPVVRHPGPRGTHRFTIRQPLPQHVFRSKLKDSLHWIGLDFMAFILSFFISFFLLVSNLLSWLKCNCDYDELFVAINYEFIVFRQLQQMNKIVCSTDLLKILTVNVECDNHNLKSPN